ncbi:Elongation factor 4 [Neomoorella glycerini]|uniref:Translation initiation factor IF-2 n=1 Tax=Neomoorella glycerini TaxID=55779 RepID=A0A6I5ZU27_9FIRM|nr:translation initiation factor IF-2 [Moorella glycerini]QGP93266.1 Elongation factor 4 [Moorella glycerini]
MAKTRVYELAKELRVSNKDLMDTMAQLGIYTRSHMSVLENGEVIKIRNHYRQMWRAARAAKLKQQQAAAAPPVAEAVAPSQPGVEKVAATGQAQHITEKAATGQPRQGAAKAAVTRPEGGAEKAAAITRLQQGAEKAGAGQPQQVSGKAPAMPPAEAAAKARSEKERQLAGVEPVPAAAQPERPREQEGKERSGKQAAGKQQSRAGGQQAGQQPGRAKKRQEEGQARRRENKGQEQEGRRGPEREERPARVDQQVQVLTPAAAQRPAGKGAGRPAKNKQLRIPKPPEAVTKDLPEKRRDRPAGKPAAKQAETGRSRKLVELEQQREERLLRRDKDKNKAKAAQQEAPKVVRRVTLTGSITVQELAKRIGKTAAEVIKFLMGQGVMATINKELDIDTAAIIAQDLGAIVEVKEEKPLTVLEDLPDAPETLQERPPVVTVMGHVDHGKTSLLDAIRRTNVTATEAGGITQHIGAYQVKVKNRKITFLDTPGHEAFTAMRARGAQATDIAILVVAADDGVMPQTVEAINHAKAAGVPIVVAINKIDRPDANPDRVKQQLTEYGLVPEEWGGDTIMVPVSALKKEGLNELLEMTLLTADMMELKANPNRPARGIVIEAQLDKGRGPVATMLVQKGTLKVGDNLVAGAVYGRVRALFDDKGERVKSAEPSMPVEVLGLSELPQAGDIFQVVEDEKLARQIATLRQEERRQEELKAAGKTSLDDLFKQMEAGEVKELNLVVKGDVQGSVEALRAALEQLSTSEVKVNIIHGGVGAITETDVMLAAASKAIIIGFNVRPDANARKAAEEAGVEIRLYRVIYEIIDEVKAAMTGLLEPVKREVVLGRAEVRATFKVPKVGTVAGCLVTDGKIQNRALARVIRDGVVVFEGRIDSLKRFKDDVREVAQGYECGIGLEKYNDIKEGDVIEAYMIEEVKREL